MNIKTSFVAFAICCASVPALAQYEGDYLRVQTSDGWKVLDLNVVDKLSFNGNTMSATDKNNNVIESFNRDELSSMIYSETSAVSTIISEEPTLSFSFDAESKAVRMMADAPFFVYDADGKLLISFPDAKNGEIIDLSALKSGIVILKAAGSSVKSIIK